MSSKRELSNIQVALEACGLHSKADLFGIESQFWRCLAHGLYQFRKSSNIMV